ncbi:MAG: hypothetical protein ABIZ04_15810 [Opitutus sp.]
MKPIVSAPLSLAIGYFAGALYFTAGCLANSATRWNDYQAVLTLVALFTFTVGAVSFRPAHFLIRKERLFWRPWICGPIGAALGFTALWLVFRGLALQYLYGGQAAIIGAGTFLASQALTRKEPSKSPDPTPSSGGGAR